jgi:hypothetical protein
MPVIVFDDEKQHVLGTYWRITECRWSSGGYRLRRSDNVEDS